MKKNIIFSIALVAGLTLALAGTSTAQFGVSVSAGGNGGIFNLTAGHHLRGARCGTHVHSNCCIRTTPGHWTTRCERVWVPGCSRRVWVRPVYRTVCTPCGGTRRVLVRAGHYRTVPGRGYYKTVNRRVWVPGRRQYVCGF